MTQNDVDAYLGFLKFIKKSTLCRISLYDRSFANF